MDSFVRGILEDEPNNRLVSTAPHLTGSTVVGPGRRWSSQETRGDDGRGSLRAPSQWMQQSSAGNVPGGGSHATWPTRMDNFEILTQESLENRIPRRGHPSEAAVAESCAGAKLGDGSQACSVRQSELYSPVSAREEGRYDSGPSGHGSQRPSIVSGAHEQEWLGGHAVKTSGHRGGGSGGIGGSGFGPHSRAEHSKPPAMALFRYALIFINFTFVVAAMMLIMSGVVAQSNSAVRLCVSCGRITLAALVLGIIMWVFTIFGFIWIRQRNILFLLVYVGFLVLLSIALMALIIAAAVYDRDTRISLLNPTDLLNAWMQSVNDTENGGSEAICALQQRFNCSGFLHGCCLPDECYDVANPPSWVSEVCPTCDADVFGPPSTAICTDAVYSTVRKNLGGFLVIVSFAMALVLSGIAFALLTRKASQVM